MRNHRLGKKLILLAGVGVLLILSGCNNNSNNPTTTTSSVSLIMRGAFWDASVIQPLIDAYQQLNPNVHIDYANRWPSSGSSTQAAKSYRDDLDRIFKAGNTAEIPDLFMVENTWSGHYANYAAPAPSAVIDAATVKRDFLPAVVQDFARNDKVIGLPMWMDTLAIIYNKSLLAAQSISAPPSDTTNFQNEAIQLTTRSSGVITSAGFAAGSSANVGFAPEYLNLLFLQSGVSMIDANGNPIFANYAGSQSAVTYLKNFAANGGSWDNSQKFDAIAFLEGKLAMMVGTSWRLNQILSFNDLYSLNLNIGVSAMPQLPSQPEVNWATYWGVMVANNRPNSTEAWKFLTWLTQPDQLRQLRKNEQAANKYSGILFPRTDMLQEADITGNPYTQVFNAELPTAQSWYMVNGLDVRNAFSSLIDSAGGATQISQTQTTVQNIITTK